MSSGNLGGRIVGFVLGPTFVLFLSTNSLAQSTGTLWGRVSDPNRGVIRDVLINPIALPTAFFNGDSFVSQDLRLTRKIALQESFTLSVIAEAFNIFNIANLTGYGKVLNQPNYGQPSARVGQVFGTGGPRAFQFGTRLTF